MHCSDNQALKWIVQHAHTCTRALTFSSETQFSQWSVERISISCFSFCSYCPQPDTVYCSERLQFKEPDRKQFVLSNISIFVGVEFHMWKIDNSKNVFTACDSYDSVKLCAAGWRKQKNIQKHRNLYIFSQKIKSMNNYNFCHLQPVTFRSDLPCIYHLSRLYCWFHPWKRYEENESFQLLQAWHDKLHKEGFVCFKQNWYILLTG